jgi:hypothetical protein
VPFALIEPAAKELVTSAVVAGEAFEEVAGDGGAVGEAAIGL